MAIGLGLLRAFKWPGHGDGHLLVAGVGKLIGVFSPEKNMTLDSGQIGILLAALGTIVAVVIKAWIPDRTQIRVAELQTKPVVKTETVSPSEQRLRDDAAERERLRREYVSLNEELRKDYREARDALKAAVEETRLARADLKQSRLDLDAARVQIEQLSKENARLSLENEQLSQKVRELAGENGALKARVSALESERDAQRGEIAALKELLNQRGIKEET